MHTSVLLERVEEQVRPVCGSVCLSVCCPDDGCIRATGGKGHDEHVRSLFSLCSLSGLRNPRSYEPEQADGPLIVRGEA